MLKITVSVTLTGRQEGPGAKLPLNLAKLGAQHRYMVLSLFKG